MAELPVGIYEQVVGLCAHGDRLAETRAYEAAIAEYSHAWAMLPAPKSDWNAATWILAALADAYFLNGHSEQAREALEHAMTCPNAIGNPFLHLRLGQTLFDAGSLDAAAEELIRAYMGAGESIFETEDPKYLEFLGTRAIL